MPDDLDLELGSIEYLPLLEKYITQHGTSFQRHYCTVALCCPSRVSLLTGKAAHNTNVTNVQPPYGGYTKFIKEGLNTNYLPLWLKNAGYNTYYAGKLMNGFTTDNYNDPAPNGFTGSEILVDPGTYQYYNACLTGNNDTPAFYPGLYNTDVIANKTYGFLDDAIDSQEPFFLVTAPIAPHSESAEADSTDSRDEPPQPAKRHSHLFQNVTAPRTPDFNPLEPSGAFWIRDLPYLNETVVDYLDAWYRARLQAIQAVDELIEGVIQRLEAANVLENTYIIFTSDNGFHIGNHRLQPGKSCGYETDVHLPFIIRGPGIEKGATTDLLTTHTDLAPLIMSLIGEPPRPDFDGVAFPVDKYGLAAATGHWHETVNIEFWGGIKGEGFYGGDPHLNIYKSLRLIGRTFNLYYAVWCSGDHELYDMTVDQYQMDNILLSTNQISAINATGEINHHSVQQIVNRLDALMLVLKTCKGLSCVQPWAVLHPEGDVESLEEALADKYNSFYAEMPTVKFEFCALGYLAKNELPMWNGTLAYGE